MPPLAYPPFQTSKALQEIAEGKGALRRGTKGTAVRLFQAGLIQVGIPLPGSMGGGGVPDGDFGAETEQAVKAFQTRSSLEPDGAVGKKTLAALDTALYAPAAAAGPKPIPIVSTREYKVGLTRLGTFQMPAQEPGSQNPSSRATSPSWQPWISASARW
jgi:peptidoglycan hydrolase-like protein with peptidoglycan-binding domain